MTRIEDVYTYFVRWQVHFTNVYLLHLRYLVGDLLWADLHDRVVSLPSMAADEARRWQILSALYFPEFEGAVQEIEKARAVVASFFKEDGVGNLAVRDAFIESQARFEAAAEQFKNAVAERCQKSSLFSALN